MVFHFTILAPGDISKEVKFKISKSAKTSNSRRNCYLLFRQLFDSPEKDIYQELEQGEHISIWKDYFGEDNYKIHDILSKELPDLSELKHKWREDISPRQGKIKPIESIYKVWTTDPSCEMPFADDKGYLMSDWAQHMEYILDQIGKDIPDEFQSMPDFIGFELELMSILVEKKLEERQKMFLEHHMDWIPDMRKEAEKKQISQFYREVIRLLEKFVREEWKFLGLDESCQDKFKKFTG